MAALPVTVVPPQAADDEPVAEEFDVEAPLH
jgi:hypothetical protein